jgi:tripartite-type tricarboxylate transporter receptor subunit TctC
MFRTGAIRWLGAAACGLAALCVGVEARAEFKASSVSLMIPSGIGGGYDTYGRLASRHLGRFLPGNPAILAKNMPGAGGIVLANYMYNVAPKDGSAIAIVQGGTPFEPLYGNTQAKYDVAKFNWLVSLNRLVSIGIFWHTTRIRTPDDLFRDDVLVGSSGGGDASTQIMPNILNLLAGTKFKVITGYKGTGDSMLAMERGEVEGIVGHELNGLRAQRPDWLRDHKVRIVIQIGFTKSPDISDVPMAVDLVKDEESRKVLELLLMRQQHGRPFLAPPGTPPDIVATLRQAFTAMAKDPAFLQDAANIKADILVSGHEDIEALLARTYASPRPLIERAIATFRKAGGH